MNARQIIENHGGSIVEHYELISNWGYVVSYKDSKYDVRRWANCYGMDCGWGVAHRSGEPGAGIKDDEWVSALSRDLNNTEINTEW